MEGSDESPSTADRALWLSIRAWGGPEPGPILARFADGWRDRLPGHREEASKYSPAEALSRLREDHRASARPNLSRIHPSWLVRALRDESPAVRAIVEAHGPPSIRGKVGEGPAGVILDRGGDPEAIDWALTFWNERLLGDTAERPDDPPVVVAITRMRLREVARLVKACGQAKHAFAIQGRGPTGLDEALVRMRSVDRVRIAFFRRRIGVADPRLAEAARRDLATLGEDPRRGHSRMGLLTFGRLLEAAEPHRARWSMQHLPYPIIKRMKTPVATRLTRRALAAWESWILEAAWARLLGEGRLEGHREFGP